MTIDRRIGWLRPRALGLLVLAWLSLLRFRIALWAMPWRRLIRNGTPPASGVARFSVERLEQAVRAAARFVPGATCLTQALALNHLLHRHGYPSAVQIGVKQEAGRFAAHAWVEWRGGSLLSSAADVAVYSRLLTWPPRPS